jgi:NAD(P)-dependent dehydrogenase (short-subunit alcohol dehydrogenase family)
VTGAARGIGRCTAELIVRHGGRVALVDRDVDELTRVAAALGDNAIAFAADVADRDAVADAVEQAVAAFGGLDLVIANAGIPTRGARTVGDWAEDELERVMTVNVTGAWNTVRAALPHLSSGGRIALVASVYSFSCGAFLAPYAMSKSAVEALGRALRVELAPRGIDVTVAYFGPVDSAFATAYDEDTAGRLLQQALPSRLVRRITPQQAATALVSGIERGRGRVITPSTWRVADMLRGPLAPVGDALLARHPKLRALAAPAHSRVEVPA